MDAMYKTVIDSIAHTSCLDQCLKLTKEQKICSSPYLLKLLKDFARELGIDSSLDSIRIYLAVSTERDIFNHQAFKEFMIKQSIQKQILQMKSFRESFKVERTNHDTNDLQLNNILQYIMKLYPHVHCYPCAWIELQKEALISIVHLPSPTIISLIVVEKFHWFMFLMILDHQTKTYVIEHFDSGGIIYQSRTSRQAAVSYLNMNVMKGYHLQKVIDVTENVGSLQPPQDYNCGIYCIFYLLLRIKYDIDVVIEHLTELKSSHVIDLGYRLFNHGHCPADR